MKKLTTILGILDFLRKLVEQDFEVANRGKEVEPQAKALCAVSIPGGEDPESFDERDGIFDLDSEL